MNDYTELKKHVGHKIECLMYDENDDIAIGCKDCSVVLFREDNPDIEWVDSNKNQARGLK